MAEGKEKRLKKREKLGNCGGCNKPVKKIKRYYRDSKYYCNRNCYKNYLQKLAKENQKDD